MISLPRPQRVEASVDAWRPVPAARVSELAYVARDASLIQETLHDDTRGAVLISYIRLGLVKRTNYIYFLLLVIFNIFNHYILKIKIFIFIK